MSLEGNYTALSTSYLYDGNGARVAKIPGTGYCPNYYFYGSTGAVQYEEDDCGDVAQMQYFGGRLMARYLSNTDGSNSPETAVLPVTDHLGTSTLLVDTYGNVVSDQDFFPFGGAIHEYVNSLPSTFPNMKPLTADPYQFTGKERDSESGLDYFGARYYGSSMGRWMSPDYNESDDDPYPIPYGDLGNPQSLNLYGFVGNNPLSWVDEDEHSSDCDGKPDPSLVCIVTTGWDWLKNHLGGGGGGGGSAPPGSAQVAPSPDPIFYTSYRLMVPGVVYGNPNGPKGNLVGGCPLSTCHTLDGLHPPLKMTNFDGMYFMTSVMDGGFGVSPFRSYEDAVAEGAMRYPQKAGRIEYHHIDPKYMEGDINGPTVPIDAAAH